MKYPQLYQHFQKHIPFPEKAYNELEERLIKKSLKKKDYLVRAGKTMRYMPYIKDGLLLSYRIDESGNMVVVQIRYSGSWLGDPFSFFTQKPTHFNIQAFQDTELLLIDYDTYEYISDKYPVIDKHFRHGMSAAYYFTLNKVFNINSQSSEELYKILLKKNPTILEDIPHYMIASYLGIKPQSLSRIRNQ